MRSWQNCCDMGDSDQKNNYCPSYNERFHLLVYSSSVPPFFPLGHKDIQRNANWYTTITRTRFGKDDYIIHPSPPVSVKDGLGQGPSAIKGDRGGGWKMYKRKAFLPSSNPPLVVPASSPLLSSFDFGPTELLK